MIRDTEAKISEAEKRLVLETESRSMLQAQCDQLEAENEKLLGISAEQEELRKTYKDCLVELDLRNTDLDSQQRLIDFNAESIQEL